MHQAPRSVCELRTGILPAARARNAAAAGASMGHQEGHDEHEGRGVLLRNCNLISMIGGEGIVSKGDIWIWGKRIEEAGPGVHITDDSVVETIDIQGGYVIPGLCDAHVHVTAVSANLHDLLVLPASLVSARAAVILEAMLMRGFTTVRDAGGCDWGLAKVGAQCLTGVVQALEA